MDLEKVETKIFALPKKSILNASEKENQGIAGTFSWGGISNIMNDWNPNLYLQYNDQRLQPSVDLVSRIQLKNPVKILDYGCGPGNSTQVLRAKWPNAEILGTDYSQAMIAKAKSTYLDMQWDQQDITTWEPDEKQDLVFSNAVIQWIFNHDVLISKLIHMTKANGAVAFQIPQYDTMPIATIIDEEFHLLYPESSFSIHSIFEFHDASYYYDQFQDQFEKMELWKTSYLHEMKSYGDIVTMIESTGLRPYLEKTEEKKKTVFFNNIMKQLPKFYKQFKNGNVLFPFERLFVIGYRGNS